MNERVKQLWSEAAKSNFGDSWEEQTAFMSKFAELIVAECANVADDNYIHRGSRTCGLAIRLHFGVEE
jgi:hypothetical protein